MSEVLAVAAVSLCAVCVSFAAGAAGNELQRLQNEMARQNAEIQALVTVSQNGL